MKPMIVTISYAEGMEPAEGDRVAAANEEIIQKVCGEVSEVYGLSDEEELSVLLCNNEVIHQLNKEYVVVCS